MNHEDCPLPTSHCRLPTAHCSLFAHCHCLLPLPPVPRLPSPVSPPPTANCPLPAHCQLLIVHCQLPTANCQLPPQRGCGGGVPRGRGRPGSGKPDGRPVPAGPRPGSAYPRVSTAASCRPTALAGDLIGAGGQATVPRARQRIRRGGWKARAPSRSAACRGPRRLLAREIGRTDERASSGNGRRA